MTSGRAPSVIIVVCISAMLLANGCGGDGGCGCDLPRQTNDWLVDVTFGSVPNEIASYPIFVDVIVRFTHLETGDPPPDGMMVTLSISPGSFDNGVTEIDQPCTSGHVSAVITIDNPAVYSLGVSIRGEDRTVTATLDVGV